MESLGDARFQLLLLAIGLHSFSAQNWKKVKVKLLSRVQLFVTPWTVAHQASLSMGFSRQEYWSGLPLPSPGDLPHPGMEPRSLALQAYALPSESPGKLRTEHGLMLSKEDNTHLPGQHLAWKEQGMVCLFGWLVGFAGPSLLLGPFSSCREWGYYLFQCTGFSLQWLLLLRSTGSRHVGFSSCNIQAQLLRCILEIFLPSVHNLLVGFWL